MKIIGITKHTGGYHTYIQGALVELSGEELNALVGLKRGDADINGEGLCFKVVDSYEKPKDFSSNKPCGTEARAIDESLHVCGGEVAGYTVSMWDGRVIEVNGSKLESVEWQEVPDV